MATHICPECNKNSFTWSTDEEETFLTRWGCSNCSCMAYEDESKERECQACHKNSLLFLKDEIKTYWWCWSCNKQARHIQASE